ncbi:MAG: RluA family pseudouridine synthase [Proteobacteria bacterium]|nr:RluA family pseudouridine synthase [Cystobacterineae bacterium]MCL2258497.1 RluA family pseudouridine synthase [Cystobacterineae bacterium]MCL2315163.1 RluA family pseudouridine synthase [Pseudomonadota bacterium]
MFELSISEDYVGVRLDKFLRKQFPDVPVSHLFKLVRTKNLRLNNKRAKPEQLLLAGDVVSIRKPFEALSAPLGQVVSKPQVSPKAHIPLHILHEDDWILVVDKPSGMAVHPGSGIPHGTVVDFVRAYLGERAIRNGFSASPAHRLDKDTSGILVVAKRRPAMVHFTKLLTEGKIKKRYLALIKGRMPSPRGKIEVALAERQQTYASKLKHGRRMQEARTLWQQLEHQSGCSLLSVTLETGRTHQIRRHFAAWSRPVLGDTRYGDFAFNRLAKKHWGLGRMFLHACTLEFAHPKDGEEMRMLSSLPSELGMVLANMGFSVQGEEGVFQCLGLEERARKEKKEESR